MQSMTGFGSSEAKVLRLGKIYVELKSTNHKSLEIIFRLAEGFSSLEDRIKKEIERKIKRGRVICIISVIGEQFRAVYVNQQLIRHYMSSLQYIKKRVNCRDQISLDTLINLPGALSLLENKALLRRSWPGLKKLVNKALGNLIRAREGEGRALSVYLKSRIENLQIDVDKIQAQFNKALKTKLSKIDTDEEKVCFLKEADISEEIERLRFHINNMRIKLSSIGPIGKELDFIAQEIQREANTIGAKAFDVHISAIVIRIKSETEKIREQLQNIE